MKRLFSLAVLLFCSLTLCASAARGETWRLTDSPYSDSLPVASFDNAGRLWVGWLSDSTGDYDVYNQRYNGASWTGKLTIHADAVDQQCCQLANDTYNGFICVAWDSAGKIQMDRYAGYWDGVVNVVDSIWLLSSYWGADQNFYLASGDSGQLFIAWSSHDTIESSSAYLKRYIQSLWQQPECIMQGDGLSTIYDNSCYSRNVMVAGEYVSVLAINKGQMMGGDTWYDISLLSWIPDSSRWVFNDVYSWYGNLGNYTQRPKEIASRRDNSQILVIYRTTDASDTASLLCKKYNILTYAADTTYLIVRPINIQSGSVTEKYKTVLAWSDSHSIFLNTYYDTIWSYPPVRISDTSLHNCINPDIVASNDSTVWVCYQNDGDIYVTRTSAPLGVSEEPIVQIPNPQSKIGLKVWPNPASNMVHFSYTLPSKRNSSVSVYDITGRLVKNLEVRDDQINWNCADNAGYKVSSGVYFARLTSDGQETIKRISIIK